MQLSTDRTPLKVLNVALANQLAAINGAARLLRRLKVQVLETDVIGNRIVIDPNDAWIVSAFIPMEGFSRGCSAGSTRYRIVYQGVTFEWREPISAARPADWRVH
ncbi:hypothetical protein [Pseudomonas sp. PS02288]|uniref:hypothetical protein n=1 Tax=Pseudomonas sp. PS02288 TaxID=2991443 RepID=UPI00249CB581|nr:hypothetical protein [Pseudomonas sp. PS02288]